MSTLTCSGSERLACAMLQCRGIGQCGLSPAFQFRFVLFWKNFKILQVLEVRGVLIQSCPICSGIISRISAPYFKIFRDISRYLKYLNFILFHDIYYI